MTNEQLIQIAQEYLKKHKAPKDKCNHLFKKAKENVIECTKCKVKKNTYSYIDNYVFPERYYSK